MARTAITINAISVNTALANPTDTTADATNSHVLTPTKPLGKILLRVTHTASGAQNFTVKAGDNPPAIAAGQGDFVTSFAAGNVTPVVKFFVLSSDRFQQDDGTINIDLESGFTGTIGAFSMPAGV